MFAIKYVRIIVAKYYKFTNTLHILISSLIWWCQTWRRVCHIHSRPTRSVKANQNAIYWPSLHSHQTKREWMLDIFISKDVDEPIFEPSIHLQLEVGEVIMFPWFVFQVPQCQNDLFLGARICQPLPRLQSWREGRRGTICLQQTISSDVLNIIVLVNQVIRKFLFHIGIRN